MGLFSRKNTTDFSVPILQQIQQEEESKSARQIKAEEKALEKEKKKKKKNDKANQGVNIIYEDYDDEDDVEVVAARNHKKVEGDVPSWVSESSAKKNESVTEPFVFEEEAKEVETEKADELTEETLQIETVAEAEKESEELPISEKVNEEYSEAMEDTENTSEIEAGVERTEEIIETSQNENTAEGKSSAFVFPFLQKESVEQEIIPTKTEVTKSEPALSVPLAEITDNGDDEESDGLELDLGEGSSFVFPVGNTFPSNAQEPVKKKNLLPGWFGKFREEEKEDSEEGMEVVPDLKGRDDDEDEDDMAAEEVSVKETVLTAQEISAGDSTLTAEAETGPVLENDWEEEPGMEAAIESNSAINLIEIDKFDWENELPNSVEEQKAEETEREIATNSDEVPASNKIEEESVVPFQFDFSLEEKTMEVTEIAQVTEREVPDSAETSAEENGYSFEMEEDFVPEIERNDVSEEHKSIATPMETYVTDEETKAAETVEISKAEYQEVSQVAIEAPKYSFEMEEETASTEDAAEQNEPAVHSEVSYSFEMEEPETESNEAVEAIEPAEASETVNYSFEFEETGTIAGETETVQEKEPVSDGYSAEMEEPEIEVTETKEEMAEEEESVNTGYSFDMEEEELRESQPIVESTATVSAQDSSYSPEMEDENKPLESVAESEEINPVQEKEGKASNPAPLFVTESEENSIPASKKDTSAQTPVEAVSEAFGEDDFTKEKAAVLPALEEVKEDKKSKFDIASKITRTRDEKKASVVPVTERPNINFDEDDEEETEKKAKKFVSPIPLPKLQKKEKPEKEENKESDVLRRYKNKRFVVNAATTAVGLVSLLVCFGVAVKTTVVASGSMEPTLMTGDMNVFNRLAYIQNDVQRGDIITFWSKENNEQMSKRIIGVAGDHIEFHDGYVFINGLLADESQYLDEDVETNCSKSFDVPEGCVFVLGDNRENSIDSRFFANPYISEEDIIGKYLGTVPRIW